MQCTDMATCSLNDTRIVAPFPARDERIIFCKSSRPVLVLCQPHIQTVSGVLWDSPVGIATRYGLDGPGIESRWGSRFSAPIQTGSEAHPASYTMRTGSFPEVKRPGRGVDNPPHLAPRLKRE